MTLCCMLMVQLTGALPLDSIVLLLIGARVALAEMRALSAAAALLSSPVSTTASDCGKQGHEST